jgi:hypothetical protein
VVSGETDLDGGIVLTEDGGGSEQITALFRILGVIEPTQRVSDLLSPICPPDQGGNEYQLTIKTADENTFYEVRAGHVWSLPAKDILESKSDCSLNMNFAIRGDSNAGFIISRTYCDYDAGIATSCQKYNVEDGSVDKYCFASGLTCNNDDFLDGDNWIKFNPDGEDGLPLIEMAGDTAPSEIRVKAVGGTIGISYSFAQEGCIDNLRMFQLRATANCQGVYRGKEILIPEQKWHDSIFDYVIFNAEGSL